MRFHPLFLVLLPLTVTGNICNTIYLCLTFGIGGIVNECIARPKCEDGFQRLGLPPTSDYCGCIADVESWPCIKGVGGCSSSGIFCIQDDLCGDSRFSMTFTSGGGLETSEELYSYFFATSPSVYEIRILAQPQDGARFGTCLATIDSTSNCQACSICADGVTFTFDCSNVSIDGASGPVVTDCLNFIYQKV